MNYSFSVKKWSFLLCAGLVAALMLFTSCEKKSRRSNANANSAYPITISIFSMANMQQEINKRIAKWSPKS